MPTNVLQKVNSYYDYIWTRSYGFNESEDIFNQLPCQLKYDLMKQRYQEAYQNALIFKNE